MYKTLIVNISEYNKLLLLICGTEINYANLLIYKAYARENSFSKLEPALQKVLQSLLYTYIYLSSSQPDMTQIKGKLNTLLPKSVSIEEIIADMTEVDPHTKHISLAKSKHFAARRRVAVRTHIFTQPPPALSAFASQRRSAAPLKKCLCECDGQRLLGVLAHLFRELHLNCFDLFCFLEYRERGQQQLSELVKFHSGGAAL